MAMFSRRAFAAAAGCVLLAACQTSSSPQRRIGMEDPFMGEAVKYNAAVQTINPDPIYPEDAAQPGDSGAKGAAAVRRYRADDVNARHRREARQSEGISTTGGTGPR